jgi:hypothetical protein
MIRALVLAASLAAATIAHADVFTITPPSQTIDNVPLDPANIKAQHLVCTGPTAVDARVTLPATSTTISLAGGAYVCRAQTIGAYDCSITDAAGSVWTMGPPDANGNAVMFRDGADTQGAGPLLAFTNGTIYATGTDGKAYQWGAVSGWSLIASLPTLTANTPQIFPQPIKGECASAYTGDLSFTIPILKPHRLRPKQPALTRG